MVPRVSHLRLAVNGKIKYRYQARKFFRRYEFRVRRNRVFFFSTKAPDRRTVCESNFHHSSGYVDRDDGLFDLYDATGHMDRTIVRDCDSFLKGRWR